MTRAALHEFQTGLGDNHVGFDVERVLETIDIIPVKGCEQLRQRVHGVVGVAQPVLP